MGQVWWRDRMAVDGDGKAAILEIDGCRRGIRCDTSFNNSSRFDEALD